MTDKKKSGAQLQGSLAAFGLDSTRPLSGTYGDSWIAPNKHTLLESHSPIDSALLGTVAVTTDEEYEAIVAVSAETFLRWRTVPAPKRGELIYEIASELRRYKQPLGELVTREMGKISAEGLGEVQEAIDIADFAVGLSRQLYGLTMHSERSQHRMYEQWHPLGPIGVITAFNFPVAVWAWNSMLGAVCGNTIIWKPSQLTPLSAIATMKICAQVAAAKGFPGLFSLIIDSSAELGKKLAADHRIPLVSATGSCAMGRHVGQAVASRMGRSLLELGGNNALIVLDDANLDLAVRAIVFGAVGTAGQRCTTTRRVLAQKGIAPELTRRLLLAYQQVRIGNPLIDGTLCGPLVSERAVEQYLAAVGRVQQEGGEILCGGTLAPNQPSKLYVQPTIVKAHADMPLVREETFAPILYLLTVENLDEAIALQNAVPQGLSSSLFTDSLSSAEQFLSCMGSDCGIANVNLGTSGAEIGGAFGGEKETGGGRESGSDSWKAYMRRQTNTINWGKELPLAQGIKFS